LELSERIEDRQEAAICTFNLGHSYVGTFSPAMRDLDQAETWYRRSLGLRDEGDRLSRARCLGQLGLVARERFTEARAANGPEDDCCA